ncbi:MAG: hypothetical protein DI566_01865 [Microbacterium sp.]|nr:MAG: hypothetical protein DI566_01865 [Microbacterium sp.]
MPTLELAQVVVSSVATICMIGLGFLYRPSRASALWSLTFVVTMIATYVAMTGASTEIGSLSRITLGVLLAVPALIWSGLRAHRGARPHEWIAVAAAIAISTTLVLLDGTDAYAWAFRLAFTGTAAFCALALVELLRRPERAGGTSMPLAVFSLLVIATALVGVVAGLLNPGNPAESLAFVRDVNSLGMLAYVVCALVSLLFITRGDGGQTSGAAFRDIATDRLARAQRVGERSWALVYVQLDDADDLRVVSGEAGFAAICDRLQTDLVELFPTEADIGRMSASSFAVLVAQPATVVRDRVRTLLRTVAQPHDSVRVGTSASAGWAGVSELGYDLDVLLGGAHAAADRAAAAGGDRWERART